MPNPIKTYFDKLQLIFRKHRHVTGMSRPPGGPQADPGDLNFKDLGGNLLGELSVEEVDVNVRYTERWVIKAPGSFGPGAAFEAHTTGTESWADMQVRISNDPNVGNYKFTAMDIVYADPPSEAEILSMPDTPAAVQKHQFRVENVTGTNTTAIRGVMFRQVNPNDTSNWIDTWRLFADYVPPFGGATGTRLRIVPVTPVAHLRQFLLDAIKPPAQEGCMVHTSYSIGLFPTI